jgi:hypothetical protein
VALHSTKPHVSSIQKTSTDFLRLLAHLHHSHGRLKIQRHRLIHLRASLHHWKYHQLQAIQSHSVVNGNHRTIWCLCSETPLLRQSGFFFANHFIYLTVLTGIPCDIDRYDLPPNTPPPPPEPKDTDDYFLFSNEQEFQLADFFFSRVQMSAGNTSLLMDLWAALQESDNTEPNPPFHNAKDLHDTIDSILLGDIPWEGFKVKYDGEIPAHPPSWMTKEYEVWYRNPLDVMESQTGNPDFTHGIDYAPKEVFGKNKKRHCMDLMSGQWAWDQAVCKLNLKFYLYRSNSYATTVRQKLQSRTQKHMGQCLLQWYLAATRQ